MASDLIAKHKSNTDFIILDVRTPREFKSGHIEKAILLDYYSKKYTDKLKRLDKSKTYLIYCRSGNRSGKTLDLIRNMGFSRVYNMDQGIIGWRSKGFPVVK
ncbi:MAG: rhodanese-like domain-containing protein [Deltaproteobacteria bacterium]|nr:rhodanese-like domain-containing protein [Deltaproteobacteria bacterium]